MSEACLHVLHFVHAHAQVRDLLVDSLDLEDAARQPCERGAVERGVAEVGSLLLELGGELDLLVLDPVLLGLQVSDQRLDLLQQVDRRAVSSGVYFLLLDVQPLHAVQVFEVLFFLLVDEVSLRDESLEVVDLADLCVLYSCCLASS